MGQRAGLTQIDGVCRHHVEALQSTVTVLQGQGILTVLNKVMMFTAFGKNKTNSLHPCSLCHAVAYLQSGEAVSRLSLLLA